MQSSRSAAFVALVCNLALGSLASAHDVAIHVVEKDGVPVAFEASGMPPGYLAAVRDEESGASAGQFGVYVMNDKGERQLPALAGRYTVEGTLVRFTPQYALRPGGNYLVELYPVPRSEIESPARLERRVTVPAKKPPPRAHVTAIYPSAETLPDNQLRFYIHFSAPMSRGEAYSRIRLLDAAGKPVERSFLEIGEELWDNSCQRLTVLFDPGRVKRGLLPREEFGPVLEAGKKYTLVVDKAWRDELGRPLDAGYSKPIVAGPPVETALDPQEWKIAPPAAGTREPLAVRFDRPLDRALLAWTIDVELGGKAVAGEIAIGDEERRWEFRPQEPWRVGTYALSIDQALEDTAGNRIGRPFEVDVFERVDQQKPPELVRVPFEVK